MASDSISERRQLFDEGLDAVDPQIKGLKNKINDDISPDLKAALTARLNLLQDRHNKIVSAIATQDAADASVHALEHDGFPDLPDMEIAESLYLELQEEGVADDAAAAGFEATPKASTLNINLGTPADKPQQ